MADQVTGVDGEVTERRGIAGRIVAPLLSRVQRWPIVIQALVGWVPGGLIFFRAQFFSGFDRIGGDSGDARFVSLIHEHWFEVFRRSASWASPDFFYPAKGTLGYSDTFFLNQILYAPLRIVGMDQFLAFAWTVVLLSVIGFVGMYVVCVRVLSLRSAPALLVATAFAFANNLYVKSVHPQMYSVYWLPIILICAVAAGRASNVSRQVAWGATAGAVLGLVLFSTFYVGWFAALSALIFVGLLGCIRVWGTSARSAWASLRRRIPAVLAFVGGLAIALIPFVVLYLPVLRSTGGRRYDDAMIYAAHPGDVVNLGSGNYLWGSLLRHRFSVGRLANGEVSLAVTPVLMALVAVSALLALIQLRSCRSSRLAAVCFSGALTVCALVVLPIRFDAGSLWRIPWTVVPGASGIRAIDRLQIVTGAVACLTVAAGLVLSRQFVDRVHALRASRLVASAMIAALAIVVLEQLNLSVNTAIDRSEQVRTMLEVPPPPAPCTSFFVIDSSSTARDMSISSVDAMLVSERFRIPTLNGYSGQYPSGFGPRDPGAVDYLVQVRAWAAAKGIEVGLCSYDLQLRQWADAPAP